jgi:hypothetical protein
MSKQAEDERRAKGPNEGPDIFDTFIFFLLRVFFN